MTRIQHHRMGLNPSCTLAATAAAMLMLSGCANLSGVGGDSRYACKAPEGVTCDSVSGTYANALHNNLPSQRRKQAVEASTTTSVSSPSTAPQRALAAAASTVATTGTLIPAQGASPLRSQARVLRLWTKPWEDADGDLYDQGYVYVQVSSGQWLIDHVQRQIRDVYAPLRPPPKAAAEGSNGPEQGAGSAVGLPSSPRATPGDASFAFPSGSSVGSPLGTSFNRTQ